MKQISIPCTGYTVDADLYEGSPDKVMLVLHGWSSNKQSQEALVSYIVQETGMTALAMEYSGHGASTLDALTVRPAQHFLEVIEAYDWLIGQFPTAEVSVLGTSYGGYMAVQLTKYRDFHNLILRVPAIYAPRDFYKLNMEIDRQHEKRDREDQEFLDTHPLLVRASQFRGRTLVVWHDQDEYIPRSLSDKYIKVFHADSYCAKGWNHSFKTEAPETEKQAYREAILDWLLAA